MREYAVLTKPKIFFRVPKFTKDASQVHPLRVNLAFVGCTQLASRVDVTQSTAQTKRPLLLAENAGWIRCFLIADFVLNFFCE